MSHTAFAGTVLATEGPPAPGAAGAAASRVPRQDFQYLQALEDAICYRVARANTPCADCEAVASGRCEDHDRDVELIGEYRAASELCVTRIQTATRQAG